MTMKRTISLLLALALLSGLLCACRPDQAPAPPVHPSASPAPEEPSSAQLLTSVWMNLGIGLSGAEIYGLSLGEDAPDDGELMAAYIEGAYGLAEGGWEDAAIARETGASAVELAVLRFADEDAAKHGEDLLKEYLHAREGDFTGYAPSQAKLVADAALCRYGRYVGLFICQDSGSARTVFTTILQTGEPPEPTPTPGPVEDVDELLDILLSSCGSMGDDISSVERVDGSDPDKLKSILEDSYGLAGHTWEEAAVARGTDGSVFEIAVLRAQDERSARDMADVLVRQYLDVKEEDYARFPAQAELLSRAIAACPSDTSFVILTVCNAPDEIIWNAISLLGTNGYSTTTRHWQASTPDLDYDPDYPDRIRFTPPNKDDMSLYDTAPIRAAWAAGDPSGLSGDDWAVYDAAREILDQVLRDGMTDLEKEAAVYGWLVDNVDYDWTHQTIMATTPRTSYQPYGGLVDRTAVCLGYATSFQLLCDLAGVECITVVGAAFNSEEDHAWNMVRLDGDWYCVDATWDANYREQGASSGREEDWQWFNMTSDEMARNHQWDYANTPEAVTGGHGRG